MDRIGLVFDFDGTMCQLFKNYDLVQVVAELHYKMEKYGYDFPLSKDAFDIFEFVATQDTLKSEQKVTIFGEMNEVLVSAELEAVKSCELVKGVNEVIPFLIGMGYRIGVATNNSNECVSEFMNLYCNGIKIPIVGRIGNSPQLMKPNKWSLDQVLKKMNCKIENTLFFGDTQRDYECSVNAGCRFIGVAPTEKKLKRLQLIKPKIEILPDFYSIQKRVLFTD